MKNVIGQACSGESRPLVWGHKTVSLCVCGTAGSKGHAVFGHTHTHAQSPLQSSSIPQQLLWLPGKGNYLLSCLSGHSTVGSEKKQRHKVCMLVFNPCWIQSWMGSERFSYCWPFLTKSLELQQKISCCIMQTLCMRRQSTCVLTPSCSQLCTIILKKMI